VNDVLDLSKIEAGKIDLKVQPVSFPELIEDLFVTVRPLADERRSELSLVVEGDSRKIVSDPRRVRQILLNLLSNAIKFTPRGGRVQILSGRVNSHLEIVVSDTGQGISPDFLPHVFDRFRQADQKTSRQHGGMGLGLAIVRHLRRCTAAACGRSAGSPAAAPRSP
jgi:signal transduction histidine kinase